MPKLVNWSFTHHFVLKLRMNRSLHTTVFGQVHELEGRSSVRPKTRRFIPHGAKSIWGKYSDCIVYLYEDAIRGTCTIGYDANAIRASFHCGFSQAYGPNAASHRAAFVATWIKDKDRPAKDRADYAAERRLASLSHTALTVGSVLRATCAFEAKSVSYYQVTAVVGRRSVWIRSISEISFDNPSPHIYDGYSVPDMDNFMDAASLKRVSWHGDGVKISRSNGEASLLT